MTKWLKIAGGAVVFLVVFVLSTSLTIRLTLKEAPIVSCPDVTGLDYEEAKRVGAEAGLSVVATKWEIRKDMPYNRVLSQRPDAAVSVREGRTITVILSDGPKPTLIPKLVGLSVEEAQGELEARGMPLKKVLYVPNASVGKVIAQSPADGEGILGEGGMVLVAGGREKRFFVMPQIPLDNIAPILQELDKKEIRYSVASTGLPDVLRDEGPTVRMIPRIVFSEDAAIELPAGSTGGP